MRHDEFVGLICSRIESLGLEYFVVGSTASIFFGEPRLTQDVDLVVELPSWKVRDLVALFPEPDFYVSDIAAREAVDHGGMFNVIHVPSGFKADLVVFQGESFDEAQLSRKRRVTISGVQQVWMAAPEDVILKKLVYYKEGSSDKHLRDITGMIRVLGWSDAPLSGEAGIDRGYLEHWALRLGVAAEWRAILTKLGVPGVGG
ncbi:MAG: hypothetical protein JNM86_16000 [Phycisphaerae bacterium]|nr:hypothetical protein [Phycisphaerae bacterium]